MAHRDLSARCASASRAVAELERLSYHADGARFPDQEARRRSLASRVLFAQLGGPVVLLGLLLLLAPWYLAILFAVASGLAGMVVGDRLVERHAVSVFDQHVRAMIRRELRDHGLSESLLEALRGSPRDLLVDPSDRPPSSARQLVARTVAAFGDLVASAASPGLPSWVRAQADVVTPSERIGVAVIRRAARAHSTGTPPGASIWAQLERSVRSLEVAAKHLEDLADGRSNEQELQAQVSELRLAAEAWAGVEGLR